MQYYYSSSTFYTGGSGNMKETGNNKTVFVNSLDVSYLGMKFKATEV